MLCRKIKLKFGCSDMTLEETFFKNVIVLAL